MRFLLSLPPYLSAERRTFLSRLQVSCYRCCISVMHASWIQRRNSVISSGPLFFFSLPKRERERETEKGKALTPRSPVQSTERITKQRRFEGTEPSLVVVVAFLPSLPLSLPIHPSPRFIPLSCPIADNRAVATRHQGGDDRFQTFFFFFFNPADNCATTLRARSLVIFSILRNERRREREGKGIIISWRLREEIGSNRIRYLSRIPCQREEKEEEGRGGGKKDNPGHRRWKRRQQHHQSSTTSLFLSLSFRLSSPPIIVIVVVVVVLLLIVAAGAKKLSPGSPESRVSYAYTRGNNYREITDYPKEPTVNNYNFFWTRPRSGVE